MEQPAPQRISEIRFTGNDTTQPAILLQEMSVRVGDPVDAGKIEQSRQAIMDLGLFKQVRTRLLPSESAEGQILEVGVDEKIYLLPVPRLGRNADGDISYGFQLRGDNLFGLNQGLRLTYERTRPASGDANNIRNSKLDYSYPRLAGTPYGLNVNANRGQETVDMPDDSGQAGKHYDIESRSFGMNVTRYLERTGSTKGWRVSSGMVLYQIAYEYEPDVVPLYADDRFFALTGGVEFADVRDYLYSRSGEAYGYGILVRVPLSVHQHEIFFRQYNLVTEKPHHNLNYQFRLGAAYNTEDAYAIGGSSTLRGYPRNDLVGDAYVLANIEYLAPLFGERTTRGVLFLDVGNTYDQPSDIDLLDLKASVGIGLRYVLKSFVNIQLRLDYAYALSGGTSKGYGGTKDSF